MGFETENASSGHSGVPNRCSLCADGHDWWMSVSDALEADGAEDEAGELPVAAGSQDQQLGILAE